MSCPVCGEMIKRNQESIIQHRKSCASSESVKKQNDSIFDEFYKDHPRAGQDSPCM